MVEPGAALRAAWECLAQSTPLERDCGGLCSAACCRGEEEQENGMLLFPGEAALYDQEDASWMRLLPSGVFFQGSEVPLLVCEGSCPRQRRPLACRIFPLGVKATRTGIRLRMDDRGRSLCPLADSGVAGLSAGFVQSAQAALEALAGDPLQLEYLRWLSRQIDAYAAQLAKMRREWTR